MRHPVNLAFRALLIACGAVVAGAVGAATFFDVQANDPQVAGDPTSNTSATNDRVWFIYTDTRNGVGCPAVDDYQQAVFGTSVVRADMADRIAARLGQNPYSHDPGTKPAPQQHCGSQFGNSDAYVSVITP